MKVGRMIAITLIILLTNGAMWLGFRKTVNRLQTNVANLQTQTQESERFINNFCSSITLTGRKFDVLLESRQGLEQMLDNKAPRQLILAFRQESCMACVVNQLRIFNKIQQLAANRKNIRAIGMTDGPAAWTKRLARVYTLRIPIYSEIKFNANLRDNMLPLVTLIDQNHTILASHRPIPGKNHFSLIFYGTIQGGLDLPSPLFNFKDAKPSDIVMQRVVLNDDYELMY